MADWENLDDSELLTRIQQGTHHAFAVLVRRHSRRFYNLSYRFTASCEDAEDIVQEAFLDLWRNPFSWRHDGGASFTTWFHRIIVNRCINHGKKLKPVGLEHDFDSGEIPADEALIENRQRRLLESEIATLPERQRVAINLCVGNELSNADAANIMKINIKALESLLARAKATLRKKIGGGNG